MRVEHGLLIGQKIELIALLVVALVSMSALSGGCVSSLISSPAIVPADTGVNVATFAIHDLTIFSVTISPVNPIIDINQSVTFTATDSQSLTYTYVWFLNSKEVGSNSSTYTFTPTSTGSYSVYVNATSQGISRNSNTASATVDSTPTVSISPTTKKITVGQSVTFQSNVTGGTGTFSYLWYLNGTKTSVTTSTYTLTPAGNATYYVYLMVNDTGTTYGTPTISVKSNNAQITAVFVTYPVEFSESGLPAGTKWYVNLTNGQSRSVVGSLILFYEPNGTYTYTISSGNKVYAPSPSYGTFTIYGDTVSFTITFQPVTYPVSFNETGLPNGTVWYVNVSGQPSLPSAHSIITSSLSNGSYTFTISTVNKEYYPTPYSGSIRVNGHAVTVSVEFSIFTYPVEFTENGLPVNTEWFLAVTSNTSISQYNSSGSSFSQTISLSLPNGTYNYSIVSGIDTFGPFPANGTFQISGNPVSKSVQFLRLYTVTFVETGLPISSSPNLKWFLNITDPQYYSSKTSTISFWEPNGTYSYSVSTNDRWYVPFNSTRTGSFTVNGSAITPFPSSSPIVFNELFNVTFKEQKLPNGSRWFANVTNGGSYFSTNSTITFTAINGSYSYEISTGNKLYRPSPFSGIFNPNQTSFPILVQFNLVTYPVTFSEKGLTNGTFWSIIINNITRISTNQSIFFKLSNGSYEYSIQALSGFSTSEYIGNITVNGSPIIEPVTWNLVTYPINVTQSGIPAGKSWSVTLQGETFNKVPISITINTTKTFVTFYEPNGTYNYTINAPFGYTGSHVVGRVVVNGKPTSTAATLVPPNFKLIGIIGVVIVAVLAVILFLINRHENRSFFVRDGRYVKNGKYLKYKK